MLRGFCVCGGGTGVREEVIIKSSKFRDWEAKSTLPSPPATQGSLPEPVLI